MRPTGDDANALCSEVLARLAAGGRMNAGLLRQLAVCGFENPDAAVATCTDLHRGLAADAVAFRRLFVAAAASAGPDLALAGLLNLARRAGKEALLSLDGWTLAALAEVAAVSASLYGFVLKEAERLDSVLGRPGAPAGQAAGWVMRPFSELVADFTLDALARCKRLALLRLAMLDLTGAAALEQVFAMLSDIADTVVAKALELACRSTGPPAVTQPAQTGAGASGLIILAMGKLGGRELNYSSDIDLVFFADERAIGKPQAHALAEPLLGALEEATSEGRLYRVDLRLRPEGSVGELVPSVRQALEYYRRRAALWEYQAFIKARPLAADTAVATALIGALDEIIYPRHLSAAELAELADLRTFAKAAARGKRSPSINPSSFILHPSSLELKHSAGGIRDVEFAVQWYQLLNGRRLPGVRQRSTLAGIEALEAHRLISATEAATLETAYRFLRTLEHRLQLAQELQTFSVPQDAPARRLLARAMHLDNEAGLVRAFQRHTAAVESVVVDMLERAGVNRPPAARAVRPPSPEERRGVSSRYEARIRSLEHRFGETLTAPVREALRLPFAPDKTLERAERLAGMLPEAAPPAAVAALLRLCIYSDFFMQLVPGHVEWLLQHIAAAGRPQPAEAVAGAESGQLADWLDRGTAGTAALELAGLTTPRAAQRRMSALIEAIVLHMLRSSGLEDGAAVFALGRLAVRECGYRSDADLLFVAPDRQAAAGILREVQEMLRLLNRGVGVATDERLRPEGGKGVLLPTSDAFMAYLEEAARPWEHMALWARMRPLNARAAALEPQVRAVLAGAMPALPAFMREAAEMRRLQVAQADRRDIKRGTGGSADVELLVHAMQAAARIRADDTLSAARALHAAGMLTLEQLAALEGAGRFLSDVERRLRIRRVEDNAVLPAIEELRELAAVCGYRDGTLKSAAGLFADDLEHHRRRAGQVFEALTSGQGDKR